MFPVGKEQIIVKNRIFVCCTQCGKEIHAVASQLGREVRCPHCHQTTILAERQNSIEAVAEEPDEEWESEPIFPARKLFVVEDVDMTPMVDVTFLLLIFFMVTAAFSLQRSLEIPPPDSDQESQSATEQVIQSNQDSNSVIVRITKDNAVWVEDREIPSRQELLAVLRDMTNPQGQLPPVTSMLVFADAYARHETVVMVLDAGNAVSMKDIQLKTEWEDE